MDFRTNLFIICVALDHADLADWVGGGLEGEGSAWILKELEDQEAH